MEQKQNKVEFRLLQIFEFDNFHEILIEEIYLNLAIEKKR